MVVEAHQPVCSKCGRQTDDGVVGHFAYGRRQTDPATGRRFRLESWRQGCVCLRCLRGSRLLATIVPWMASFLFIMLLGGGGPHFTLGLGWFSLLPGAVVVVGVAWTLVWSRCAPFHGEADEALARSQALALAKEGHDRIWTRGRYWLQRDSIWQDEGVAAPPMPEGWRPTRREPMVLGASAVTGLVVAAVASSPFWYASAWRSLVNVNARGYCYLDGTPLHEAAYRGTVVVANRLLARGAGINAKDGNGNTPLHNAVLYGRSDLVRVLLENRADVNAADKGGMTPLHRAACSGHVEVGRLLLDKGANMHAVREGGRTPLSHALECRHPEFAALLREHGATK